MEWVSRGCEELSSSHVQVSSEWEDAGLIMQVIHRSGLRTAGGYSKRSVLSPLHHLHVSVGQSWSPCHTGIG